MISSRSRYSVFPLLLCLLFLFQIQQLVANQLYVQYRISSGETVYGVANRFDIDVAEMIELNKIQHVAIDVKSGDTLLIPFNQDKHRQIVYREKLTLTDKSRKFQLYQVKQGDTYFGIARKFNTQKDVIRGLNPALNTTSLQPGMYLLLPVEKKQLDGQRVMLAESTGGVRHEVKPGESLFSIARAYGFANPEPIRKQNQLGSDALQPGQVLMIPAQAKSQTQEQVQIAEKKTEGINQFHVVEPGETLFSIARKYGFQNPQPIRELNQLTSDELSPGQRLMIKESRDADYAMAHATEKTEDKSEVVHEQIEPEVQTPTISPVLEELRNEFLEAASPANVIEKRGIASWIEDAGRENSFLALTNEAPIGSVLKLTNLMNNREVYVRVIGRMPATDRNTNLVIKVSESAARSLNVLDNRFLVEISIPER